MQRADLEIRSSPNGSKASQLEDMLREMPQPLVVQSILEELNANTNAVEVKVVGELFHTSGRNGSPLREVLPPALREQFRTYLKPAMESVLAQDDPHGQTKAHFATVLAQVGGPSDLGEVERLIKADLVRMRAERAARCQP